MMTSHNTEAKKLQKKMLNDFHERFFLLLERKWQINNEQIKRRVHTYNHAFIIQSFSHLFIHIRSYKRSLVCRQMYKHI